jgi:hypothetical protein
MQSSSTQNILGPASISSAAPVFPSKTYARRKPEITPLYKIIAENIETFFALCREQGPGLPRYIENEFYKYLECGILAHGFVKYSCTSCIQSKVVPFSCCTRSFCPSCMGRRMNDTAAQLVEYVFPKNVPVRQFVLSFPIQVRYRLAKDPKLVTRAHKIFTYAIKRFYQKKAAKLGFKQSQTGAVSREANLRKWIKLFYPLIYSIINGFNQPKKLADRKLDVHTIFRRFIVAKLIK